MFYYTHVDFIWIFYDVTVDFICLYYAYAHFIWMFYDVLVDFIWIVFIMHTWTSYECFTIYNVNFIWMALLCIRGLHMNVLRCTRGLHINVLRCTRVLHMNSFITYTWTSYVLRCTRGLHKNSFIMHTCTSHECFTMYTWTLYFFINL